MPSNAQQAEAASSNPPASPALLEAARGPPSPPPPLPRSLPFPQLPWLQLSAVWVSFFVGTSVIHIPATLLGGSCPTSPHACSIFEQFPHLDPGALGWLPSSFLLIKGLLAVPTGKLMDRIGVRACLLLGNALILVASFLFAFAPSFDVLVFAYLLFGLGYCLCGMVPLIVFTNGWFTAKQKASAIGVIVTAYAASGVLWPALAATIAQDHGWRAAAMLMPGSVLFASLPLLLVLRDGPYRHDACPPLPNRSAASWSRRIRSIGCPLFSLFAMGVVTLYIISGTQHMLVMFLTTEVGLPLSDAGGYLSLTFAASLLGKVIWGLALDTSYRRIAALLAPTMLAVGSALLVRPIKEGDIVGTGLASYIHLVPARSATQLVWFSCIYGLGYGATFTLVQSRSAQLYGHLTEFAVLQSTLAVGQYAGAFLGTLITSQLRSGMGSFVGPFALFPILGVLNVLLCLCVIQDQRATAHEEEKSSLPTAP